MGLDAMVLVLAGGSGKRLWPLTAVRNKPAVPFGGKFRLIDFPLSNATNSHYKEILVITQGRDNSFNRHIIQAWSHKISSVLPITPQEVGGMYSGTADAVRQLKRNVTSKRPRYVIIASGDHVVKMNYRTMVDALEHSGNDAIVALIEMPLSKSKDFGAASVSLDGKVTAFEEKRHSTPFRANDDLHFFASMGIYAFKTDALFDMLKDADAQDFGKDIMPRLAKEGRLVGYDFKKHNRIPGFVFDPNTGREEHQECIPDSLYWEDVGLISTYFASNLELVCDNPPFNLLSPLDINDITDLSGWWPISTATRTIYGPARLTHGTAVLESILNVGVILSNVQAARVIFSPSSYIDSSKIEDSIIFEGSFIKGSKLKNTIVDKYANVERLEIGPGIENGELIDQNSHGKIFRTEKGMLFQDANGITVVPKYYGRKEFQWRLYQSLPQ